MNLGEVVGGLLPLAIAVAISVLPIIATVLILFTPRARVNGLAFAVGWVVGLTIVGAIVLIAGSASGEGGQPSTASGVAKLAFGLLFLALARRNWSSRPAPGEVAPTPSWMAGIDGFTAPRSLATAFALAAINPKNLALTIAGASVIAAAGLSTGEQVISLALFVLIASSTIVGPVAYYLIARQRAERALDRLKVWLIANNATVMAVLLVVIGFKLIGDGISTLSD